jgi:general stress protein CsbA
MYFLGKTDKKKALHHIKYAALMAVGVVILFALLNPFFARLLTLVYLAASGYFAYQAYMGKVVKIDILDSVEEKISKTVKK